MSQKITKPKTSADTRLAAYGTLVPGEVNHHQLAGLNGKWIRGTVKGRVIKGGRGVHIGLPGMILDNSGEDINIQIFVSPDLVNHWQRLDDFEGENFRRVVTKVSTEDGTLEANIYEIITP